MPRAVAPLFVAAVLILLVGAIVAGVRFGGGDTPTAVGPTETETTPTDGVAGEGTDDETETESPSPTPSPTPSPDQTVTTSPSPTETGTTGQAQPGETGSPDTAESPDGTASPTPTESPTDDDREAVAIDDMPDTGGGAAAALAGFLVLTGAAGLTSRDR